MKNKIIIIAVLCFLMTQQSVNAQEITQKISLDEKTVVKGYTIKVKNEGLSLAVKPGAFLKATNFNISASTSNNNVVNGHKVKSKIYKIVFNNKTEKPLLVKINWQSFSNLPKNIYWRKNQEMTWQQLPSKTLDKETSADIIESGEIILLEKTAQSISDVTNHLTAKSAVVLDADTGKVLYEKNANQVRSIASLTKLMTAMVYLERPQDWSTSVSITNDDKDIPVTIGLKANESLNVKSMWYAMLAKSANDSAKAIARLTGLTKTDFIKRMNSWAKELDLKKTSFSDPSGLDEKNKSTALETAILARAAFTYPPVVEAAGTKEFKTQTNTNRELVIKNSSPLFDSDLKIIAAKTGYTTEAGRCQVIKASGPKRNVIVVVLGSGIGKHTTDAYDLGNFYVNK